MKASITFDGVDHGAVSTLFGIFKLMEDDENTSIEDVVGAVQVVLGFGAGLAVESSAPQPHADLSAELLRAAATLFYHIWHDKDYRPDKIADAEQGLATIITEIRRRPPHELSNDE